jgi:hypothetical protein
MKKTLALLAIISAIISFSPAHAADPGRRDTLGISRQIVNIASQIDQLAQQVITISGQDIDPQILEKQRQGEIENPRLNALLQQINNLLDQMQELESQYNLIKTHR